MNRKHGVRELRELQRLFRRSRKNLKRMVRIVPAPRPVPGRATPRRSQCPCPAMFTEASPGKGPGIWTRNTCFLNRCRYNRKTNTWTCEYICSTRRVPIFDL